MQTLQESPQGLTPMKRFWRLLKPDYQEIRNVYVYAIFSGLIGLSLPLGIQAIVNLIQGGQVNAAWLVLVSVVVLGVAFTGVLQIFQLRITEYLQQKIFTRAAFEFAFRIPRIRMDQLYQHYAPELVNRFFDTISVQKGLAKILLDFSTAALYVVFGLILLSLYHPFFILFSILLVVLVYAIFKFTAARGLRTSLEESHHKYKIAHWLEELARTGASFRLAGNSTLPMNRTDTLVGDYLEARESHFQVLVRQYSLLIVFKVIIAAGLLALGGYLVMQQRMNIGQFVAAEIIILVVMTSVEKLILTLETIYDVLTALEKIAQVTDMELEQSKGVDLTIANREVGLAVDLHHVSFAYPGSRRKILDDINISVTPGEKLVITGPNGSGKSTLLNVISGLYDTNEGYLTYDGFPKGNLKLSSLRTIIGDYMSHEELFEGTVLENISTGRPDVSFEDVKRAVDQIGLTGFIQSLPDGYETMLNPQGKKLPRSIVQRMLVARAIANKPRLLLLEDALIHMDENDRRQVIDVLTDPTHKWSMIAITSDKTLARKADRLFTMNDGRLTEVSRPTRESIQPNPKKQTHA